MSEENVLLGKVFYWKDKYKIAWCSLCERAIISCPEENCPATSCNCTSCPKCHDDLIQFNEQVKVFVEDYLSEEEIFTLRKTRRLEQLILESIKMGDKEIDWNKMENEGKLCIMDHNIFDGITL